MLWISSVRHVQLCVMASSSRLNDVCVGVCVNEREKERAREAHSYATAQREEILLSDQNLASLTSNSNLKPKAAVSHSINLPISQSLAETFKTKFN